MAKIELTAQQRMAVEQTGGTLLVSAAAGSGKTKVLVDRLLRQVCAPETPCNVDDFLIITYTRAAAAENICRRLNELHQLGRECKAKQHQNATQNSRGQIGRGNGCFQITILFCAKHLCENN